MKGQYNRLRLSGRTSLVQAAATSQPLPRVHGLPSIPAPAASGFLSVFRCISMLELPSARARARSSGFPEPAPWAAEPAPWAVKGSRGYDHLTSQRIKLLLEVSHLVFERLETCNLVSQRDDIVHHHGKLRKSTACTCCFPLASSCSHLSAPRL